MSRVFKLDYIPDPNRGRPLFDAKIFIGEPNTDPTIPANQLTLTGDIGFPLGGVITLTQPVRTNSGGVTVYNNSPVDINTPGQAYSIQIFDRNDNLLYNFPNVDGQIAFDTTSQEEVTGLKIHPDVGNSEVGQTVDVGITGFRALLSSDSALFYTDRPVSSSDIINSIIIDDDTGTGAITVGVDVYNLKKYTILRQSETTGLSDITDASVGMDLFPLIGEGVRVDGVGLWVVPSVTANGSPMPNPANLDSIPGSNGLVTVNGSTSIQLTKQSTVRFDTLDDAKASTSLALGQSFEIKERVKGGGGGGVWDVVEGETSNGFNIVDHNTLPLQLELRIGPRIYASQLGAVSGVTSEIPSFCAQLSSDTGKATYFDVLCDTVTPTVIKADSTSFISTNNGGVRAVSGFPSGTPIIRNDGYNASIFKGLKISDSSGNSGDTSTYGIVIEEGGENWRIEGCNLSGVKGNAIGAFRARQGWILRNRVNTYFANGVLVLQTSEDIEVSGNIIDGTNSTQNNIFAIGQSGNGSTRINIHHNFCLNSEDFGIEVGDVFTGEHSFAIVDSNIVYGAKNSAVAFRRVKNGIISNNTLDESGSSSVYGGDPIFCTGDSSVVLGLVIDGNMITCRSGTVNGIHITNYASVSISGGSIDGASRGIYLESETGRTWRSVSIDGGIRINNCTTGIRALGNSSYDLQIGDVVINSSQIGLELTTSIEDVQIGNLKINNTEKQAVVAFQVDDMQINGLKVKNPCTGTGLTDDEASAVLLAGCESVEISNFKVRDVVSADKYKWAMTVSNCTDVGVLNTRSNGHQTSVYRFFGNTGSFANDFNSSGISTTNL